MSKHNSKLDKSKSTDAVAKSQTEKYQQAAQELGTDDDPERFAARVRELSTNKKPTFDAITRSTKR